MICKVCSAENVDTSKFCISCGSVLSSVCPQCGADITDAEYFCPSCGEAVHTPKVKTVKIVSEPPRNSTPVVINTEEEDKKAQAKTLKRFFIMFGIMTIPFILMTLFSILANAFIRSMWA